MHLYFVWFPLSEITPDPSPDRDRPETLALAPRQVSRGCGRTNHLRSFFFPLKQKYESFVVSGTIRAVWAIVSIDSGNVGNFKSVENAVVAEILIGRQRESV